MGVLVPSRPTISPLLSSLASLSSPPPTRRRRIPTPTCPSPPSTLSLHSIHPPPPSHAYPYPSHSKPSTLKTPNNPLAYPDPIPEFAQAETQKFRGELLKKLSRNKDTFGDDIDAVVQVCAEVFSDFLHKEYGGPGTLLVEPFTDMLLALKEKKLSGAPVAARAALLWAQNFVDRDWEIWTSQPSN